MLEHNGFREKLAVEMRELERLKEQLCNRLSTAPEGSLHVLHRKGRKEPDYYCYRGRTKRKYIHREDAHLAERLAQKEYDGKLLANIEKRLEHGSGLLLAYETSFEQERDLLNKDKRKLIELPDLTDKQYIERWYEKNPGLQNEYKIDTSIFTDRGEQVRSKSEKIIADLFQKYQVPYVYEPKICLDSGKIVFPDFLLLNVRFRKTIVYEHFGMMGDENYAERTCEKINLYEQNDIWWGDKLLFSMESNKESLNTRLVEKMIKKYLL